MDKQLPFSFVGLIVPDRYWWSTIQTNSLRAKRTSTLQPTKPPTTIVLIGCSKSKLDEPAPARELYTGQLFKKAVAWTERQGHQWFVISALHGLVAPNQSISPYNYSLKGRRAHANESPGHTRSSVPLYLSICQRAPAPFLSCPTSIAALFNRSSIEHQSVTQTRSNAYQSVNKCNGSIATKEG